jgi:GT2 family glycosyltransferase
MSIDLRLKSANAPASRLRTLLKSTLPEWMVAAIHNARMWVASRGLNSGGSIDQAVADKQASSSISIVVPIHDAPQVTRRCLASLQRYAPLSEVILVDDASKLAETKDIIRRFQTQNGWKVVEHTKVRGHSHASTAGVGVSTRAYVCLLNSDTVVTPWCWRLIKEAFEQDESIGAAGPSTSYSGTEQALEVAFHYRLLWNDDQINGFAETLLLRPPQSAIMDVQWVSGFAFFIRREVWDRLGGFDRALPDYGNEVDLCQRISALEYRRVWVRSSYIHHFGQQSYIPSVGQAEIDARISGAARYIEKKYGSEIG